MISNAATHFPRQFVENVYLLIFFCIDKGLICFIDFHDYKQDKLGYSYT